MISVSAFYPLVHNFPAFFICSAYTNDIKAVGIMPGKCKTVVLYDFPQRGTMETPLIVGIFHSPKVFYVQRNAPYLECISFATVITESLIVSAASVKSSKLNMVLAIAVKLQRWYIVLYRPHSSFPHGAGCAGSLNLNGQYNVI